MDANENKKGFEPLVWFPKKKNWNEKNIQVFIYYENLKTFGQSYVYQPIAFEND